ncbi:MAG: VOC family protein [Firmicutes bacterium]|nr:VOC family protein [Bacillota bacterium]
MISGIGHVAIRCSDLAESLRFYTEVLGLRKAFELTRDDGSVWLVYLQISKDVFIELFPGGKDANEITGSSIGFTHLCLQVDDMQATLAHLAAKGLDVGEPTMGADGNWQYWIKDPDGVPIELMQIMPDSMQRRHSRF